MPIVALTSHRVVTADGVRPATVVIDGEYIVDVLDSPRHLDQSIVTYFGDQVIMPGLVDCHVHINEPGRTEWEGFSTATEAAAAGGVTSLVDMPLNCIPPTTNVANLQAKLEAARGQLHVDVGFHGGVIPGNASELPALVRAGVLSFKAFMIDSGVDEFPHCGRDDLLVAMEAIGDLGTPLLVHAELDVGSRRTESDPHRHASWLESRPDLWEEAAVRLIIELATKTGCPVHVVHLSAAGALSDLKAARRMGVPITVETCPHYLLLDAQCAPNGDTTWKCAPPIRDAHNRERLWKGLKDGVIDFVISDHSPCMPHLKGAFDANPPAGSFDDAWGGISSLQLGLPLLWTEARKRKFPLDRLAQWCSTKPAEFAGVDDRKGRIAVGHHADLVIWDPDANWTISADTLRFRHKISPYVGHEVVGQVLETWLRGTRVYDARASDPLLTRDTPLGRPLLHRRSS